MVNKPINKRNHQVCHQGGRIKKENSICFEVYSVERKNAFACKVYLPGARLSRLISATEEVSLHSLIPLPDKR